MESKVYNTKGKEVGTVKLSEKVFGVAWNADMVHQTIHSLQSSERTPVAHTKTRGEVRGGGKKPWKQKGTGRARHGSTRSPIWVGGGVAHGPRNDKNFFRKVNKKMLSKTLAAILSAKFKDGEVIFVDSLGNDTPKTKEALEVIKNVGKAAGAENLASKKKNAALVATLGKDKGVERSFANIGGFGVCEVRNLNVLDVLSKKYLIIEKPEESIKVLEERLTK